jgi:two-component system chemotaxis sensor kinase CheA
MAMDNDSLQQQLVKELLIEGFDGLEKFDQQLVALEEGSATEDTLNTIFRVIHTIKGTAGCIGLQKIAGVAHVGENLLSMLRDGDLETSELLVDALLRYSDALKEMLGTLEKTGEQGDKDYSELLDLLTRLQSPNAAGESASASTSTSSAAPDASAQPSSAAPGVTEGSDGSWGLFAEDTQAPHPSDDSEKRGWGLFVDDEKAVRATTAAIRAEKPAASQQQSPHQSPHQSKHVEAGEPQAKTAAPGAHGSVAETAIRVDVGQLDRLMNLVGELVLARNQILQSATNGRGVDPALAQASQRLNIITTELQESVMKTRMQPIDNVWAKFPRIVRDVAHELGKQVNLVMEGRSTELDRTIIEAIRDPLTHIIRNAIDHGIESPEKRAAKGKPETGTLILRAFHEGGQVIIEIMDDGNGIDVARVKAKAVEKGLVAQDAASRMNDREAFDLIFLPGFSTAEKITNVSGRGVGMDVVKSNVEKIGGSVDVSSELGIGTTLRIKIPLTLAIIPALVVRSGGERFAIPQVSLLELVRLEGEAAVKGVESLYGAPVHRLRGKLLPLAYLDRELGLQSSPSNASDPVVTIVVLQADGRQFGLVVDEVHDTEEIVVKPLGKQLRGVPCYAGATIMGDGRVALIVDVLGLARHACILSETPEYGATSESRVVGEDRDRRTLLLFRDESGERLAIPLSIVARLEEFPRNLVERSGDRDVVQYRGSIMPIVPLADLVSGHVGRHIDATSDDAPLKVIVHTEANRSVGLVVDSIEDIVDESIVVQEEGAGDGVLGTAVIQKHVTTLLDLPALIKRSSERTSKEKLP